MKKLMSVLLGLALVIGTASVTIAQDKDGKSDDGGGKKKKKKKADDGGGKRTIYTAIH